MSTISSVQIHFLTWTREGVLYAEPKGKAPKAIGPTELLVKIKKSGFTLEKAIKGIFTPLGADEPTLEEFQRSFVKDGHTLYDILNPSGKLI